MKQYYQAIIFTRPWNPLGTSAGFMSRTSKQQPHQCQRSMLRRISEHCLQTGAGGPGLQGLPSEPLWHLLAFWVHLDGPVGPSHSSKLKFQLSESEFSPLCPTTRLTLPTHHFNQIVPPPADAATVPHCPPWSPNPWLGSQASTSRCSLPFQLGTPPHLCQHSDDRDGLVTLLGQTRTLKFLPPEYFLTTSSTPRKFLLPSENFLCILNALYPSGCEGLFHQAYPVLSLLLWNLGTVYPVDSCADFKLLQVKNQVFYLCTSSYD